MSPVDLTDPGRLSVFNIELAHNQFKVAQTPPEQTAKETLVELAVNGEGDEFNKIRLAAEEINKVIIITREEDGIEQGLLEIFTAEQLLEMSERIHNYLGTDIDSHLEQLATPVGYPFYVGRLATHFAASDTSVTSSFGAFEWRHTDPVAHGKGPFEQNSREYANSANDKILRQLHSFYQADFEVKLVGPRKEVEGSRVSWEKGIAESQFLVLDYVRDLLVVGHSTVKEHLGSPTMTIEDIHGNISDLLKNKSRLYNEISGINPILAQQIDDAIRELGPFTVEVFHRGRMGTPRYQKESDAARRAIERVEVLLIHASSLAESREDQAEIPILDI